MTELGFKGDRTRIPIRPSGPIITVEDERPQEECGLIAFYAPNGMSPKEAGTIFKAAKSINHRGQQGGGVVAHATSGESRTHKGFGLLEDALPEDVQNEIATMGNLRSITIQARWGTHGGYESANLQPLDFTLDDGTQGKVSHNGNFANVSAISKRNGTGYDYDVSDSRVWTDDLHNTPGKTTDDMIISAVQGSVGAASLLINVGKETLYAARDRKGLRPLVLGKIEGEKGPIWVVSSETIALDKAKAKVVRDIRPGEVTRFDPEGVTVLEKGDKTDERMCSLEAAYMSHPESKVNVSSNGAGPETWPMHRENRYNIGRQLAREERVREMVKESRAVRLGQEYVPFNPDAIIGVPQSGIPFGEGYADEMGSTYKQLLTKVEGNSIRSFQGDDRIDQIKKTILNKLQVQFPEDWDWKGKKIVLIDDSLVRGSVSTTVTQVLQELGAEVHWRFGFPKISHPCHLGVSIRTYEELIAHRQKGNEEAIAEEIGAKSVGFISNQGFVESVQGDHFEPSPSPSPSSSPNEIDIFDRNRLCGGCITGEYPYARQEAAAARQSILVS